MNLSRYIDVIVLAIGAAIAIPLGAPVGGYAIGAGTWLLQRLMAGSRCAPHREDHRPRQAPRLLAVRGFRPCLAARRRHHRCDHRRPPGLGADGGADHRRRLQRELRRPRCKRAAARKAGAMIASIRGWSKRRKIFVGFLVAWLGGTVALGIAFGLHGKKNTISCPRTSSISSTGRTCSGRSI